jgi:Cytochrome c554 and c-prime
MGRAPLPSLKLAALLLIAINIAVAGQTAKLEESPCARCHAAQTLHQPQTPMAHALVPAGQNPLFKMHPRLTASRGTYFYALETEGSNTTYTVSDGTGSISVPIHWTFGMRMQTWVLEHDGRFYESMVSYYPVSNGLATTVGDERLTPHSLEEALGRELTASDTRQCFGCHSSNAVSDGQLKLMSMQPGVTCEHCHAGSTVHLLDSTQGFLDSAPPKLRQISSEEVLRFCGQCHRTWETVVRKGERGVSNVRFQPYRLANSKCFDGADPRISCIACHDPHTDIVRDAASYDAKCLACHGMKSGGSTALPKPGAKRCPTATANCTSCHMPKVEVNSPGGLLKFTDHTIRRALPGDPYPN